MKYLNRFQPWHALVFLVLFNLVLGFLIGNQYGQTWDEPSFYLYGERSFDAYMRGLAGQPLIPEKHILFLDLRYYGAFYTAVGWKIVEFLSPLLKIWGYMDVWHFVNFSFFQIALVALFFLAKRVVKPWTAFLVVLLFFTQPLLFGHAFINPKDIPFLTFLLASISIGLYMVDAMEISQGKGGGLNSFSKFQTLLSILFGLFVLTFVCKDLVYDFISRVMIGLYNAPDGSFLNIIFSSLAGNSNRLPVENYIHKAVSAHIERLVIYILIVLLFGRKIQLDRSNPNKEDQRFVSDIRLFLLTLGAGILLGLATSVRILAPFGGVLVAGYALSARGKASLPTLIYYFSIAAIVSYLTWPFLWDSPTRHFLETLDVMRDFPFNAEVLFMGDNIAPSDLPWYYIPFLVTTQNTEPAVILAWLGSGILLVDLIKRKRVDERFLLFLWLVVPVGLQILMKSNVYDNFRQFLFILPPLYVLAGIGYEWLLQKFDIKALKLSLPLLILLPGVLGIVALRPIQYIYYNGFIGGVAGAQGRFELDYWLTSYREAAEYINEHASPNANILAWGSAFNGARADLDVYGFMGEDDLIGSSLDFEYAVISTRFFSHLGVFADAPVVYEVRRDGALLAVVKELKK